MAGVAFLAGGDPALALRLGASMTLLQLGIGTVNDLVDAPFDAGLKPGKPIPAGVVGARAAKALAALCFGGGLAVAASVSLAVAALAVVVIGIGLAYDLRLKGTAWSWLPFAAGIPILPIYSWLGARGGLVPAFAILVPAAVAAGAALSIGNSLVDVERDRAAGRTSVAERLGPARAGTAAVLLFAAVAGAAAASVVWLGGATVAGLAILGLGSVPVLAALVGARARSAPARERAWRLEAAGTGCLAIGWVAAVLR